ncbi:MAG: MATE family efflux transporter [Candidatus Kapabacteria bacterium]|nr:MATE family efflux transporter [Candidatus Kapabacteria bacterium]
MSSPSSRTGRLRVDLLSDPVDPSLRLFALPLTFSFLVQFLYSLIDRFYVSRLGVEAIAAIGSIDQIVFFVFSLGSGFGVGSGVLIARRIGEGNRDEASRLTAQAMGGMFVIGTVITLVMYASISLIPKALGLTPRVSDYAMQYMSTLFLGLVGNFMTFQISAIVRSTGNTVYPMVILLSTTVINAIVAPFLIFGIGPFPQMGMMGAGLATASAQLAGATLSLWAMLTGKAGIRPDTTHRRLRGDVLLRIAKQGIPASLQMLSVSLNRVGIFAIAGTFGTNVIAAYTLGLYADMVVFMFVFAVGMTVEVATGQNLGAGNMSRIAAYHRSAIKQLSLLMLILGILVYSFGPAFVSLFTTDATTVAIATQYLHLSVFGYLFFAIGFISVRVISGAGAALQSMSIAAGCMLGVQLPLGYLLSNVAGWGHTGIWIAIVIGYGVFAVVALTAYRMGRWRHVTI